MSKVAWKKLRSYRGSCAGIAARIKDFLQAGDVGSFLELSEYLIHDGRWDDGIPDDQRWVEATARGIDALLDKALSSAHPGPAIAMVAEMVGAPHDRLWWEGLGAPVPPDVMAAVDDRFSVLVEAATSGDARARAAAAMVLAVVDSEHTDEARALLRQRLEDDDVPAVRASALLGLARIGNSDDHARIAQLAGDASAPSVLRGAAALGLLRLDPSRDLAPLRAALECWLSQPFDTEDGQPLFWFQCGVNVPDRPNRATGLVHSAWALHRMAQHADAWPGWRDTLVDIGCETTSPVVRRAVGDLLLLHDLPYSTKRHLVLPSELTPAQRELLERIGDRWICVDPRGLPAAGPTRMRYLGFAEPEVLERLVPIEVDGEWVDRPLAWTEGRPNLDASTEIHALDLPAAQRWRAAAELYAGLFHCSGARIAADADEERLWEAAVADPEFPTVAPRVLDELAAWFTEARAQGHPKSVDELTGAMLFVPTARAGIRFKPEWEVLLPRHLPMAYGRTILQGFEAQRRAPWLTAHPQYADRVATYIDLVPDEAYIRGRCAILAAKKQKDGSDLHPMLVVLEARIRELAETLPSFAEGVKLLDEGSP